MAVSAENARLNLRTAERNVAARMGIDPGDNQLSYDQRRAFNSALQAEILRYPQSFTPEILRIAQTTQDDGSLDDASFSFSAMADSTLGNVVPVLEGFTNKLLWILALGVVVWVITKNWRPSNRSSSATA